MNYPVLLRMASYLFPEKKVSSYKQDRITPACNVNGVVITATLPSRPSAFVGKVMH